MGAKPKDTRSVLTGGRRILAAAMILLEVGVCLVSLSSAVRWINRPFPGFLTFDRYPMVYFFFQPHWTGMQEGGLRFYDLILEADGTIIGSGKELQAYAAGLPQGTSVEYKVQQRRGGTASIAIPTMIFSWGDFLLVFGPSYIIAVVFLFLFASVILYVRPRVKAAWGYFVFSFFAGMFFVLIFNAMSTYNKTLTYMFYLAYAFFPSALIHLGLSFPEEDRLLRKRPSCIVLPYSVSGVLTILRFYVEWFSLRGTPLIIQTTTVYLLIALVSCFLFVYRTYQAPSSILVKQQARIALIGGGLTVLFAFLFVVPGVILRMRIPINFVAPFVLFFPLSISYAIYKHRLFDIDIIIRRSLIYAGIMSLVTGIYAGMILLFTYVFKESEVYRSWYFIVLFTLVIVLIFDPMRRGLRALVARAFYRMSYDYHRTLQALSETMTMVHQLDEILSGLVRGVVGAMGLRSASVFLVDAAGRGFVLHAFQGSMEQQVEPVRNYAFEHPLFRTVVEERRELFIYDLQEPGQYAALGEVGVKAFREIQACLIVPTIFKGKVNGILALGERRSGDPYSSEDLSLLKTLANQAAVSVENARVFEALTQSNQELAKRVLDLASLHKAATALGATLDLTELLDTVLEIIIQNLRFDRAMIMRMDPERKTLTDFHAKGRRVRIETLEVREIPLPRPEEAGVFARLLFEGEPVIIHDVQQILQARAGALETEAERRLRKLLNYTGTKSFVVVPLFVKDGFIGVIAADRLESGVPLSSEDASLIATLANHIALSLENARSYQIIERLNESLEEKVKERTRELKEAHGKLHHAMKHKNQFLANMSHELRTPLNAILGFTELIRDGVYGELPKALEKVLPEIEGSGRHLFGLINDVLDVTRIDEGKHTLVLTSFSVEGCVESVVSLARAILRDRELEIVADVAENLPVGYGDEKRITQVLLNLVSNAIKFTKKGTIAIHVRRNEDGDFVFSVADTGVGIQKEQMGSIFEEFRQGDASMLSPQMGTGLGLSISKKLVDLHGGRIWAESEVGRGSTFFFTLPLKRSERVRAKAGR